MKPRNADSRGLLATLLTAIVAAAASSLCCIGPLIYLVFGVSAAGLVGLSELKWLQWPMFMLSLVLIGLGFYRLYFSRKLLCVGRISRRQLVGLYWLFMPLIVFLLSYPFLLPWLLEFFE